MTFLLGGISCPKGSRNLPDGTRVEAEAFGDECAAFVKEMVLQREVEIEVESQDKAGNFIGEICLHNRYCSWYYWDFLCFVHMLLYSSSTLSAGYLFCEGSNLSVHLVTEGFASMHFTADRSNYCNQLQNGQDNAKAAKKKIWKNYVEAEPVEAEEETAKEMDSERKVHYQEVYVSEVTPEAKFYACNVADGPALETLMEGLR